MPTDNPGPPPEDIPGLESGGGVAPGDTPPDAGQTSGLSHPQPMPSRVGPTIAIAAAVLITVAFAVFFIARAADLF